MKSPRLYLAALAAALTISGAQASDFFSTAPAESMLKIGVKVGVNTSNVTMADNVFPVYNVNSWGTGFDAGVTVDLGIRDYISIQPGFFYQCRSGNFFYGSDVSGLPDLSGVSDIQAGHLRSYRFNIPIVASLHFNVTPALRWNVDFGPYLGCNLHSNEGKSIRYGYIDRDGSYVESDMRMAGLEFGLKMGTSLRILGHYNVGVHYMAGMTNAWKDSWAGGRNKCWTFSIGYDF